MPCRALSAPAACWDLLGAAATAAAAESRAVRPPAFQHSTASEKVLSCCQLPRLLLLEVLLDVLLLLLCPKTSLLPVCCTAVLVSITAACCWLLHSACSAASDTTADCGTLVFFMLLEGRPMWPATPFSAPLLVVILLFVAWSSPVCGSVTHSRSELTLLLLLLLRGATSGWPCCLEVWLALCDLRAQAKLVLLLLSHARAALMAARMACCRLAGNCTALQAHESSTE